MEHLAVIGVAIVFIVVGYGNKVRGNGPWVAFLIGGAAMLVVECLRLSGVKF